MNHVVRASTSVSTAAQLREPIFAVGETVVLADTDEIATILAIDGGVAWVFLGSNGHETVDVSELKRFDPARPMLF
jgi:predicted ABC-class ATPase